MTFFPGKISIFRAKISDDRFFSHLPGFSDFPFLFPDFPYLYYVKCRISPFPHKKNTFFYSVPTFTHLRQHYFSKYWGNQCMGRPPPQIFLGTVPQVSALLPSSPIYSFLTHPIINFLHFSHCIQFVSIYLKKEFLLRANGGF